MRKWLPVLVCFLAAGCVASEPGPKAASSNPSASAGSGSPASESATAGPAQPTGEPPEEPVVTSDNVVHLPIPGRFFFHTNGLSIVTLQMNASFRIAHYGPLYTAEDAFFLLYPEGHFATAAPRCAGRTGPVLSFGSDGGFENNPFTKEDNPPGRYRLVFAGLSTNGFGPATQHVGFSTTTSGSTDVELPDANGSISYVPMTQWKAGLPIHEEFDVSFDFAEPTLLMTGFRVTQTAGAGPVEINATLKDSTGHTCIGKNRSGVSVQAVLHTGTIVESGFNTDLLPPGKYQWQGRYQGIAEVGRERMAPSVYIPLSGL